MIKLIIFDFDGVLADCKEMHYETLNQAIAKQVGEQYIITKEEHLTIYDGLPTREKLELLQKNKNIPYMAEDAIWHIKQWLTADYIRTNFVPDDRLIDMMRELKKKNYLIYVASNSIGHSLKLMLLKKGFMEYVDMYFSNDDVKNPKPHSEIYLKAMIHAHVNPKETLILEDSFHGREAAIQSGANLLGVDSTSDVNYERIMREINNLDCKKSLTQWEGDDFTVLIPMAGAGSRFAQAGYTFPKPLIEVRNKPMIQLAVENLGIRAKFVYLVRKEHYDQYNLKYLLNLITPGCEIVQVDALTEGAASTTLLAKEYINNDTRLIIANSDQYLDWNPAKFYYSVINDKIDGSLVTFKATHPKWSFCRLENEYVMEVAEKKPISDIATVGVYYWTKGSDYVKYAEQMIAKNVRVNNEFYVAPVYNEAIADGKKFKTFDVEAMWGIGTPEDLNFFLENHK